MKFENDPLQVITGQSNFGGPDPDTRIVHLAVDYVDNQRDPKMAIALRVARDVYELVSRAQNHQTKATDVRGYEAVLTAVLYRYGAWCVGQERPFIHADARASKDAEIRKTIAFLESSVEKLNQILEMKG